MHSWGLKNLNKMPVFPEIQWCCAFAFLSGREKLLSRLSYWGTVYKPNSSITFIAFKSCCWTICYTIYISIVNCSTIPSYEYYNVDLDLGSIRHELSLMAINKLHIHKVCHLSLLYCKNILHTYLHRMAVLRWTSFHHILCYRYYNHFAY